MQRSSLNLLIDLLAATLFLAMAATGYILWFPLPPGTNKELSLWGLMRHQWGSILFWIATALLAIAVLHAGLHWNWIVTVIRQRLHLAKASYAKLIGVGVVTGLALMITFGLFAWAAHNSVQVRSTADCSTTTASSTSAPPSRDSDVTWETIYPVLERSCLRCHGPNKQRADFRVDRPADFLDPNRALLVPGDSKASRLIAIVEGKTEIAGHKLPDSDVLRLKVWIDAGAETPGPLPSAAHSDLTHR